MSKQRVVVLKIVSKQLSAADAAELYGMSRRHIQRLLARYRDGGIEAVDPQSRAPRSSPQATLPEVADRIVQLRRELTGRALDAGPVTIEILSEHRIDPQRGYWRNQLRAPGRWPQT